MTRKIHDDSGAIGTCRAMTFPVSASMPRHRNVRWRRAVQLGLLVLLALGGTGCQSYRRSSVPAAGGPERSLGERVRVTFDSGVVYELLNAKVQGDSVVGTLRSSGQRTAIAVARIRKVEEWSASGWRTAGAVVGATVIVATVLIIGLVLILVKAAGG